jgi:hypothetical protein
MYWVFGHAFWVGFGLKALHLVAVGIESCEVRGSGMLCCFDVMSILCPLYISATLMLCP